MKKTFSKSGFFLKCLMVLLAVMASINSAQADTYYRIKMIPVLENGASGYVFAYTQDQYGTYQYASNITKDNKWKTSIDTVLHSLDDNDVQFHLCAKVGNIQSNVVGWYWNEECTQPISYLQAYTDNHIYEGIYSSLGRNIEYSDNEATAPTTTVYVKFTKLPTPEFDWSSYGTTTLETGKKYYIFSPAMYRFLKATSTSTTSVGDATLFTYTYVSNSSENVTIDGVKQNLPYNNVKFSYLEGGATKYVRHTSSWSTSSYTLRHYPQADGTYRMTEAYSYGGANNIQVNLDGTISYPLTNSISRGPGSYWIYIPESTVLAQAHVNSLNENGSVTITSSPTGQGTAYVKFNVSASSVPAGFNYELTGGDGHFDIVEESATCSGGILTVPVTYTAQNVHAVSSPASTATVTVTSKQGGDPVSGTVTAYVDLQPKFDLKVDELDWNTEGETFYKGMEIAASQRTYLSNKLIYNPAQTTGVAANNATWTATIEGTNADQFKFANGTREVSGAYTASLLDVIYAPTTTGSHTATLHIVTSYTASNGEQTYEKNITLLGTGSAASRITFAANGSETPLTAESYNYGDIIGTNHKDVTAELFISQITNPSYVWNDPAEVFELEESTIDLTNTNQMLSFRAHPDNPVAENTNYTATLTVSGKGTANEDVSATLTLTYRALPLIPTTVTWNWETMKENRTVTNPITTNSDGVWTLTQATGDAVTYNAASKSATVAYLHHEPGKKATFYLIIPQTDTYTAFEQEYETTVLPNPSRVVINRQEYLGDNSAGTDGEYGKVSKWDSSWESWDDATKTLQVKGDKIWFYFSGQTKFEFDFTERSGAWYLYEYDANNTQHTIWNTSYTPTLGHQVIDISPNTVKIEMKGNGKMTNIEFYEVDTISADYEQVALIRDGDDVSDLAITATFANKRAVTASLNATAAQYFTISSVGKGDPSSSIVFDGDDGLGIAQEQTKVITVSLKAGVNVDEAQQVSMGNTCVLTLADDYTYNQEELSIPILVVSPSEITYNHSAYGTYVVTYQSDNVPHTVSSADYVKEITDTDPALYVVTLSAPTVTTSGYIFQGWKIGDEIVSCRETFTTSIGRDCEVIALFDRIKGEYFKVGTVYYDDLTRALSVAGNSAEDKVVTVTKDTILGDGHTPITYTIPAGVTLLVPHKDDFDSLQITPDIVNLANKEVLSAYRTLTLTEGVTINCNGNICVAGTMLSANGGNKSAYTTDECGVINMVHGGHIELNDGANLYCWGYIKGQDMDQGNNTVGTGTVTANAGSVVWENFELGDWRGGSASLDIYNNTEKRKVFPFQSYAIQNIEIPTTFKFGSFLKNYTSITTGYGDHGAVFSMIGPSNTMFLLTNEQSMVRTWYDPTTDLSCYELSGTAQLDALHITVYVSMSSENYQLPISNNMHIILTDCNMTLAKPMMVQAGSIIEIKPSATVNLTSDIFMYDKDQWGKYAHNYYFRSFGNLTSHKDRGAEDSKDGLDDAKFIIDGVFNINEGGKLYTTAGGANVMGNNGGIINFNTSLPDSTWLWAVEVKSGIPYIEWVRNRVYAANLCNEDGTYTPSTVDTYYNIHGRWFRTDLKDINDDHTYTFEYKTTNTSTDIIDTLAIYSHDKTGLTERMKWFNVEADENCENWWVGANPAALYNHTMLGEWHQFMEAEGEGVYSGSNNMLYQKDACEWVETGAVDENCLYTFEEGGVPVKKALVDGHFIPLTSNGYDPAYHKTDDATKYYICFTGCNWHPATPYTGESKAYTIEPETDVYLHYIWFKGDWLNVQRDEPFFYTEDEVTNVRTYYEYVNGEWEIATPYVSVSDAIDPEPNPRTFYMIKEAFNVASIKKNATITLLRDIPNVTEVLTYTTQNTTCTLDLNGHVLSGDIANMITVNAPGATFTITDNADLKIGKISNAASKAVYVQKGTLVVVNGTIESDGANAIEGAAAATININGGYFVATSKCVYAAGTCAITGGYYNINTGLANYTVDAYPFANDDPVYKWVVEAAWTIIFKNGETTLQTLHLHPGEMPVYTAAFPTLDNHQFTGWDPAVAAATANVTYQAQFAELVEGEKCVTFNANGGNTSLPYKYVTSGSAVGELPTATKAGHTFDGWFTEASAGTQVTSSTTVSTNVTYYAHYTKNSYTLTWDENGATITSADDAYTHGSVEYGTTIIAPAVSKDGWTFEGWNVTPASTMPAANTTYTAQWTIPYTVQHKQQNLNDAGYTVFETDNFTAKSGEYVTPAVKTYDGFITPATQTVRIGETTEVTYNYARRTYTITLDATTNEGECATASVNVKHGGTAVLPAATKTGRVFEGWFTKAVGGDEITNETVIQYNIGTLYAQFSEANMNITAPTIIDDTREVTDLRITTTGKLTVSGSITATNFILESNGETASGQLIGATNVTATNAYFDLKINAKNHMWYAVAVPWQVDAETGISVNGRTLQFGKDFDILYYNGATRATAGANKTAWEYMEDHFAAGNRIMRPGVLYMIGLMGDAQTIRFAKKAGATLLTTAASVEAHGAAITTDANWNGIANPALFHAYLNAGTNVGQKYDADAKSYEAVALNTTKLVVGQPVFVQAPANKDITVTYGGAFAAAPRRKVQAEVQPASYEVSFAADNKAYTTRIFIHADEEKTEDTYVIGKDLAKIGVSSIVPQMWISRYDAKLCMNTVAPVNGVASYPLSLYAPTAGEYTISNVQSAISNEDYDLYVTYNGEAIWNLSDGAYILTLEKGTANEYGLRISVRKTPTGIDEAVVNANGETRKVLINGKVFIIRGNNVYSVHGQLVK